MALVRRLIRTCLMRVRSAMTECGVSNVGKVMLMPRRCASGSIIDWHSSMHLDQRDRLQRHRELARLDDGQIEDLVDQLQQIPAGVQDLADALFLRRRRRRRIGLHQLGEAEDGVERRAELVAHAGEEVGLGQIRFLGGGLGVGQRRLDLVALRQVAGQFGEAAQIAGLIANGREDDVRPERRAVLAHAPPFVLVPSAGGGEVEVVLRLAVLDVFARIEAGEVLADDLFRVRSP